MALPLSDTRSAGISHNNGSRFFEIVQYSVAFGRIADLLATGIDNQLRFDGNVPFGCLTHDRCRTTQVFVTGISARADQPHLDRHWEFLGRPLGTHFRDGRCGIGCKRTVEMRLDFREIELDNLIIIVCGALINGFVGPQICGTMTGHLGNRFAPRSAQILIGICVERKETARCPQLCPHITNSSLTRGRYTVETLTEIFEYRICTSFYCENTQDFQNYILRTSPSAQPTCEFYTDQFRHLQFPRLTGQYIDGICTTYANSHHS